MHIVTLNIYLSICCTALGYSLGKITLFGAINEIRTFLELDSKLNRITRND